MEKATKMTDKTDESVIESGHTAVIIHDVAPVATWVNDEMPIADAHVIARMEVGAGGIFVHDGKTYSTYYPSELAQMNPLQHQLFIDSVEKADMSTEINDSGIELGETGIVEIDTSSLIYDTPDLQAPVSGVIIEEGFLDLGDGMVAYGQTIDTDNNGIPDVLRLTNPETNQKVEIIIDEDTGELKIDEVTGEVTGEPEMRFVDDYSSYNDIDDYSSHIDVDDYSSYIDVDDYSSHKDVDDYSSHINVDPEADVTPWTET